MYFCEQVSRAIVSEYFWKFILVKKKISYFYASWKETIHVHVAAVLSACYRDCLS